MQGVLQSPTNKTLRLKKLNRTTLRFTEYRKRNSIK